MSSILGGLADSLKILYDSIRLLLEDKSSSGCVEFIENCSLLILKFKILAIPVTWTIPMNRPLFANVSNPFFTLSEDRKTVSKNTGYLATFQGFFSEQSLEAIGNTFTVDLTKCGSTVLVGVARRGTDPAGGLFSKAGSWMLQLTNGYTNYFFSNGNKGTPATAPISINKDSPLIVLLDPFKSQILFKSNGKVLYTADIPKPFTDLHAAIDLYESGKSVSFLWQLARLLVWLIASI